MEVKLLKRAWFMLSFGKGLPPISLNAQTFLDYERAYRFRDWQFPCSIGPKSLNLLGLHRELGEKRSVPLGPFEKFPWQQVAGVKLSGSGLYLLAQTSFALRDPGLFGKHACLDSPSECT